MKKFRGYWLLAFSISTFTLSVYAQISELNFRNFDGTYVGILNQNSITITKNKRNIILGLSPSISIDRLNEQKLRFTLGYQGVFKDNNINYFILGHSFNSIDMGELKFNTYVRLVKKIDQSKSFFVYSTLQDGEILGGGGIDFLLGKNSIILSNGFNSLPVYERSTMIQILRNTDKIIASLNFQYVHGFNKFFRIYPQILFKL